MRHEQIRSRWVVFASGVSVGVVAGMACVAAAVALERSRRRTSLWRQSEAQDGPSEQRASSWRTAWQRQAPVVYPPDQPATGVTSRAPSPAAHEAPSARAAQESHLDEELAQTFPASDPLPSSHRVD